MILQNELAALRAEWALDQSVIEKDYVLGWLLAGIANNDALARSWIFKGGTCLRKCYYETYRFSEDLDFTVVDGGPEEPGDLLLVFAEISAWVREECGLELIVDETSFRRRRNKRGNATTQGKIGYRGPNASPSVPKVKLDLTSDEVLTNQPVVRRISHPYSDSLSKTQVLCYSATELFGEKLRALAERCRPRDLYDVVHMYRHPDLIGQAASVRTVLARKAARVAARVVGLRLACRRQSADPLAAPSEQISSRRATPGARQPSIRSRASVVRRRGRSPGRWFCSRRVACRSPGQGRTCSPRRRSR